MLELFLLASIVNSLRKFASQDKIAQVLCLLSPSIQKSLICLECILGYNEHSKLSFRSNENQIERELNCMLCLKPNASTNIAVLLPTAPIPVSYSVLFLNEPLAENMM